MEMTWNKVRSVVFATGVVGALAIASGAAWWEQFVSWGWGW
jgi:hypothetical protein